MGDEFTVFLTSLCDMNFLYAVIRGLPVQLRRFLADDHLFGTSGIGEILWIRHDLLLRVVDVSGERRKMLQDRHNCSIRNAILKNNSSVFPISTCYHHV